MENPATHTEVHKVIANALGKAYQHSTPDILPDVSAGTVMFFLRRKEMLADNCNEEQAREKVVQIVEERMANPEIVGLSLQAEIKNGLSAGGFLKPEKE